VTVADVSRVARQYVHPDQLAVLVVGRSADFDQPLANLGKVTTLDISIPPPPEEAPEAERSAANLQAGKELWLKAVKAMGGETFKKAQSFRSAGSMTLKMGDQAMTLKQDTTMVFPDKVRLLISTPMGNQTVVLDGQQGFMVTGGKAQTLPAAAIEEQTKQERWSLPYLLHNYDDASLEMLAAGEEKIDGAICQKLAASFKGARCRLWISPDGRVARQSYQGVHPLTRAPGMVEMAASDYHAEGPVVIPHQLSERVDGQEVLSITIESLELNPQVDADAFKRPPE
jgi:hypothetical protein